MDLKPYLFDTNGAILGLDPESCYGLAHALVAAWERRSTVFICGNGGSASTANHWAQDLSKGTILPGMEKRLRATSLCTDISTITAWANDTSYDYIFLEQLRTHARPNDVLIAISGSGNSPNVIEAVGAANNTLGMSTWGVTGFDGGRLIRLVAHCVHVECDDMGMVESAHGVLGHWLLAYLRSAFAAERGGFVEV